MMMEPRNRHRRQLMATFGTVALLQAGAGAYLMRPGSTRAHSAINRRIQSSSLLPNGSNKLYPSAITSRYTRQSQLTRFYVDEWADADVELALRTEKSNSQATPPKRAPKRALSLFKRLMLQFTVFLCSLKEFIRTKVERCTVYILELEDGKYYVGSTTNRKRRIKEHIRRRGSEWTRQHKPIRVLREYKRIPSKFVLGMESRITAECMLEFGVNNVRGSMFCGTREFHVGDVATLTKFIGHYNHLNYRRVRRRLVQTLPAAPSRFQIAYDDGKCFRCGKKGHFVANCPQKLDDGKCFRCGKKGHFAANCPEKLV